MKRILLGVALIIAMLGLTQLARPATHVSAGSGGGAQGVACCTTGASFVRPNRVNCGCDGVIGDYVWHDRYHDRNHIVDGIQDADESGIAGVVIELYDSYGDFYDDTTTDANGFYQFTDLPYDQYTVKVADSNFQAGGALEGWYASPPDEGSDDGVDSDGDRNTHEVTVSLCDVSTRNDIDFGFFTTGVDLEKTGPATVNLGNDITYHFRLENTGDVVLHGGAHVYDPLIAPSGDHEIWSGVVYPGEVYEFDRTYTPDSDDCGSLTNTANAVGHPQYPDGSYLSNVTDEDSWTTQVQCNPPDASLGDRVWHDLDADGVQDAGEPGIQGVTVKLYRDVDGDGVAEPDGDDGAAVDTATTDANGNYRFENLAEGAYFLEFIRPSGYDKGSPSTASSNSDPNDSDAHASLGVTSVTTLDSGESDMTWDAGFFKYASVGDRVWWDIDRDGIQDANEISLLHVVVMLEDANGNAISFGGTGDDGYYYFDGLVPGDYLIYFALPGTNWSMSPQNQGGNDALDSDPDPISWEAPVTLTSGEHNDTVDAGEYVPSDYTIKKENTTAEWEIAPGDPISFTITIQNTGDATLTFIPVRDTYDTDYLTFVSADVAPDDTDDDGQIDWGDLATSFGEALDPGESFSIVVNFIAKAPTEDLSNRETINTATAHDVQADPDGDGGPTSSAALPSQSDQAPASILNPVGEDMDGFFAHTASNAVALQWRTASELDMVGFNVLRSSDNERFQQINDRLIFARHAGADLGASYRYEDRDAFDGDYTYILEIIHLDGSAERYGRTMIQAAEQH